jgi:hypothetical protein
VEGRNTVPDKNKRLESVVEEGEEEDGTEFRAKPITINDADVPQAFSHFSYLYSNRKKLVCDLQGVLTRDADGSSTYELTDPVIHYSSITGRKNVFGRTDRGKVGMHDFFKSIQFLKNYYLS